MKVIKDRRIDWIDSIRGIAAAIVVVHHIFGLGMLKASGITAIFLQYFDLGKIGVVLFFFVSGFVIPFSLFKYKEKPISSFGLSRFFRLYPVYWVSIAFYFLFVGTKIKYAELIFNISMLQKFFGFNDIVGVYWTLQIELIFYGLCVMLFWKGFLQRSNTYFIAAYANIVAALLLAALRMILKLKLPVALPLALAVMFMGAIWKKYLFKEDGVSGKKVGLVFITFFIAMVPVSLMAYNLDMGFGETWDKYFITYTVAPIMFLSLTTFARLEFKPCYYLGRISYSVYLLHMIIIEGLLRYTALSGNYLVSTTVAVILTFGLSAIAYHLVEKPCIDYGKRVIDEMHLRLTKAINHA